MCATVKCLECGWPNRYHGKMPESLRCGWCRSDVFLEARMKAVDRELRAEGAKRRFIASGIPAEIVDAYERVRLGLKPYDGKPIKVEPPTEEEIEELFEKMQDKDFLEHWNE